MKTKTKNTKGDSGKLSSTMGEISHWLYGHPTTLAVVVAAVLALILIALMRGVNTGIRVDVLSR